MDACHARHTERKTNILSVGYGIVAMEVDEKNTYMFLASNSFIL